MLNSSKTQSIRRFRLTNRFAEFIPTAVTRGWPVARHIRWPSTRLETTMVDKARVGGRLSRVAGRGTRAGSMSSYRPRALDLTLFTSDAVPVQSDLGRGGVALSQREAWKRHAFLQDRYEFHLHQGHPLEKARILANQDLMARFGNDTGYSAPQLEAILLPPDADPAD